jgi:hypothetical protein
MHFHHDQCRFFLLFVLSCFMPSLKVSSQADSILKKRNLSFGLSDYYVSQYVPKSGTPIGQGSADQFLCYAKFKHLKTYIWINYGFPDRRVTEADLALFIEYKLPGHFLHGELSGDIGFVEWILPLIGFNTEVIECNTRYSGIINLNLAINQILTDQNAEYGTRLHLEISKPIRFNIKTVHTTLTPALYSAYHFNFYNMDGLAFIALGLKYSMQFNKLVLNVFLNNQYSTEYIHVEDDIFLYGGFGFEYNF